MFNIKFILFGILVFLISLQSCTNEFESNGQNVCFETDVLPVLVSNCTQSGCHNDIDKEADLVINNYNEIIGLVKVGDYRASKLYQVLILPFGSARMPPSPYSSLTDEQIQTIALWIEQGALKIVASHLVVILPVYVLAVRSFQYSTYIVMDATVGPMLKVL